MDSKLNQSYRLNARNQALQPLKKGDAVPAPDGGWSVLDPLSHDEKTEERQRRAANAVKTKAAFAEKMRLRREAKQALKGSVLVAEHDRRV